MMPMINVPMPQNTTASTIGTETHTPRPLPARWNAQSGYFAASTATTMPNTIQAK
jgi:hypothetical protein